MNVTLGLEHLTANERPSRIPAILEPLSAWIQSEGARADRGCSCAKALKHQGVWPFSQMGKTKQNKNLPEWLEQ